MNTLDILDGEEYAGINKLYMVTSDYHIRRGSTFFNTAAEIHKLLGGTKDYTLIGNCGWASNTGAESLGLYTMQMKAICGISSNNGPGPDPGSQPTPKIVDSDGNEALRLRFVTETAGMIDLMIASACAAVYLQKKKVGDYKTVRK